MKIKNSESSSNFWNKEKDEILSDKTFNNSDTNETNIAIVEPNFSIPGNMLPIQPAFSSFSDYSLNNTEKSFQNENRHSILYQVSSKDKYK